MKVLAALAGAFVLTFMLTSTSTGATFSVTKTLTAAAKQETQAAKIRHHTVTKLHRQIVVNRKVAWRWEDKAGVKRTRAATIGWGYSPPLMRKIVRLWHDRAERKRHHYEQLVAQWQAAQSRNATSGSVWDKLSGCEASGDWSYNGPSGFDGGVQFEPGTWSAYRLPGYPAYAYQATREQQIAVAERVLAAQGWGAWPACSAKLGLG